MSCDVSDCGRTAVVRVWFGAQRRGYPYCAAHGLRNGDPRQRFGRWHDRVWYTAVARYEHISEREMDGNEADE